MIKSSDFLTHAITPQRAYEGVEGSIPLKEGMKLELVLRKYESVKINPSREFRCFVRNDILLGDHPPSHLATNADELGATVRDFNYYPHFQDPQVVEKVAETLRSFYEDEIMGDYPGGSDCMSMLSYSNSSLPIGHSETDE